MTANPVCSICPRHCLRSRTPGDQGLCGAAEPADSCRVARLMVHHWEEPCISGSRGSGTVFFSGCALRCCFCQNAPISLSRQGSEVTLAALAAAMLKLAAQGVHNLNLVTASHYSDRIPRLIEQVRADPRWADNPLPIIWNSSGYETVASLRLLVGTVDVYMPDLKFYDADLSAGLAGAPDYFAIASRAILEMARQQPRAVFDNEGLLISGLLVRHLVLPGHWQDSCAVLDFLAANLPHDLPLSLMSQYTPQPANPLPAGHPELMRRLTTLEYQKVTEYALKKGFSRIFGQERASAAAAYTPDFSVGLP